MEHISRWTISVEWLNNETGEKHRTTMTLSELDQMLELQKEKAILILSPKFYSDVKRER